MEIRKGQKVRVTCTEARLKEVGVKQKHIKHILGKIGTVKEIRKQRQETKNHIMYCWKI